MLFCEHLQHPVADVENSAVLLVHAENKVKIIFLYRIYFDSWSLVSTISVAERTLWAK